MELYLKYRVSNNNNLKLYYRRYCKILLSKVIKAAKKLHYDKIIFNSKNKMETTWKIIKKEKDKTNKKLGVQSLEINNTEPLTTL